MFRTGPLIVPPVWLTVHSVQLPPAHSDLAEAALGSCLGRLRDLRDSGPGRAMSQLGTGSRWWIVYSVTGGSWPESLSRQPVSVPVLSLQRVHGWPLSSCRQSRHLSPLAKTTRFCPPHTAIASSVSPELQTLILIPAPCHHRPAFASFSTQTPSSSAGFEPPLGTLATTTTRKRRAEKVFAENQF